MVDSAEGRIGDRLVVADQGELGKLAGWQLRRWGGVEAG